MMQKAKELGDELVVILNNDHWLISKKGFVFMPQKERAEILKALGADRVYITKHRPNDADRSVVKALKAVRPHLFINGGDRKNVRDIPEAAICEELSIEMVFNAGGKKVQSSSWLVESVLKQKSPSNKLRAKPKGI